MTTPKPNFFILGAPKCGTTSLAQWLAGHPNIFVSREKEPHFFNTDDRQLIATLNSYEELFREACSRHIAIGEASVWYLSSSIAVENILRYQPQARFVVMIRNPVEMAPALHAEMALTGHESVLDFGSAWALQTERRLGARLPALCWANRRLQYGDICSLGAQLQRLFLLVSRSRVLPIVLDDVVERPRREYLRVLEFLGVGDDGRSYFPILNKARIARWPRLARILFVFSELKNRTGINTRLRLTRRLFDANIVEAVRSPPSQEVKAALQEYFEPDVALLGRLLNRDFGHWLDSDPRSCAAATDRRASSGGRTPESEPVGRAGAWI
jgi:Sulfotransferase domain